jgi:arylsulfatase A-like enzyme
VAAAEKPARPNIVLVMTDDQGYGDISAHGNDVLRTPFLDVLHSESVRLTDFHVNPTCAPTRSALMTGRTNLRAGVWHTINGRSIMDLKEQTMAEVFADAGYRTGMFGKWHLGDNWPYRPNDRGFQETVVHKGGGITQGPDFWGNDYFDDTYYVDGEPKPFKGYCTDVFFEEAEKFISSVGDEPFLAYISTNAPHAPYFCPDEWKKPYLDQGIQEPRASFYGMIANIDDNVGQLREYLQEKGLAENTIFIFMTDNGSAGASGAEGFNAGMRFKKGSHYDGGHRVPFFVSWPAGGLGGGVDVDQLTAHLDVLPTLTSLTGVPFSPKHELDGQDISWMLRGETRSYSRTLFIDSQRIIQPRKWKSSAVVTKRWRMINGAELYDMSVDPGQTTDVAGENPGVVAELRRRYEVYWESLKPEFAHIAWLPIGAKEMPELRLYAHDWFMDHPGNAYHQIHAREFRPASGSWMVDVRRTGLYELRLMQVPAEAGVPLRAVRSELRIGAESWAKPVEAGAVEVVYYVRLEAGKRKLQGWLIGEDGKNRGPYYLDVKLVSVG